MRRNAKILNGAVLPVSLFIGKVVRIDALGGDRLSMGSNTSMLFLPRPDIS